MKKDQEGKPNKRSINEQKPLNLNRELGQKIDES